MDEIIYKPLDEFENKFKNIYSEKIENLFESFVEKTNTNIKENRKTAEKYNELSEKLKEHRFSLNMYRILRLIMILSIILLPFVFSKINPKISALRSEIEQLEDESENLKKTALSQVRELKNLLNPYDSFKIIEQTIPLISFDSYLSREVEKSLNINYGIEEINNNEKSTEEIVSGTYNKNPFIFEKDLIHGMGTATYEGSIEIEWEETTTDSEGNVTTQTNTQTLTAQVVKPKPYYKAQTVLDYCCEAAKDLNFSRKCSHAERKGKKELELRIKYGEHKLNRKTAKAVRKNEEFTSMSNSKFEVLFNALDRDNEIQFRSLFTPLAQTNMVDLILSKTGCGDNFSFKKTGCVNEIISEIAQRKSIRPKYKVDECYSIDDIKREYISKNEEYFKMIYFNFAPILAVPAYQESANDSLMQAANTTQLYSDREAEELANMIDKKYVVDAKTKTKAILKTHYIKTVGSVDLISVTAYSYDTKERVDYISKRGDDGEDYSIPVYWYEYIPLVRESKFFITKYSPDINDTVLAVKNDLCILK